LLSSGTENMEGAVRRLEDQVLTTVTEIQEEMERSGAQNRAAVGAAEERLRELALRLSGSSPPPPGDVGGNGGEASNGEPSL
ncbi:MAG TPA: hypothetical protein VHF91_01095, partial [Acidimicrobiales bacterium]|nr:hypothetical protein [Acidimicrobiales bacterium]